MGNYCVRTWRKRTPKLGNFIYTRILCAGQLNRFLCEQWQSLRLQLPICRNFTWEVIVQETVINVHTLTVCMYIDTLEVHLVILNVSIITVLTLSICVRIYVFGNRWNVTYKGCLMYDIGISKCIFKDSGLHRSVVLQGHRFMWRENHSTVDKLIMLLSVLWCQ